MEKAHGLDQSGLPIRPYRLYYLPPYRRTAFYCESRLGSPD